MSSRAPASQPSAYRQDDDRRRDENRIGALENQIDELRRFNRELLSRLVRYEEGAKQHEALTAQNKLALEQFRQEAAQTAQARALDENRTRQHLGDVEARLEDATRPIRSMQLHLTELLEAGRKKGDDSGKYQQRFDELRGYLEDTAAHLDRSSVISHQLRDSIDSLRAEQDSLRRDLLRNDDAIKILDQDTRRRVTEVAQAGTAVTGTIDEIRSDLTHLGDVVEDIRRSIVHVDPSLDALREADTTIRNDLNRVQVQSVERDELMIERAEDVRQEIDARFNELRQAIEQRAERLSQRIDQGQEQDRELAYRISALSGVLEELRQVDTALRRDIWILHEQRVRLRMEQIQQELDLVSNQRRDAESSQTEGNAPEPRALRRASVAELGR